MSDNIPSHSAGAVADCALSTAKMRISADRRGLSKGASCSQTAECGEVVVEKSSTSPNLILGLQ